MDLHIYGSRSTPEASLSEQGKPDNAGGPVINTLWYTWKPVYAGGHIVDIWEARHCGRPIAWIYTHMKAGLCQRPHYVYKGRSTKWETP